MKDHKIQAIPRIAGRLRRYIALMILFLMAALQKLMAQDGNAGITQATSQIKGYFDNGSQLVYAICSVVGLVGAVKVYKKWNDGDHDTGKVAASWFGSLIFAVVVTTVLKSFFGV